MLSNRETVLRHVPDRECEKTSTCSVSCDTSDLRQMLEEEGKATSTSAVADARELNAPDKNIKSYQRRNKECPFGSKLSSIREEMREFCDSMDRFVDENRIVFKNGEVERFWGERKMVDANLQTDSVADDANRDTEIEVPAGEQDKLQRWDTTEETNPKTRETVNKRQAEAQKNIMDIKDTSETNENLNDVSSGNENLLPPAADTADNFRSVYDLMTLKTCPNTFPEITSETYPMKQTKNDEYETSARTKEKQDGLYCSIFNELRYQNKVRKTCKSNVSNELVALEKKLDAEKSGMDDTEGKSLPGLIGVTTNLESAEEQSSRYKNIVEVNGKCAKIEILEDKFNDISLESPQEKRNIDIESDDDSFKTATSLQEDSQIAGSNQESPEVSKSRNDRDKLTIKHENVDELADVCRKKIISDERQDDAICEDRDINDETEKSPDKTEENLSNSEQELSTEEFDSQVRSFVRTIDRLSLERTSQPSRLTGKRTREAEDIEISNKKSFLIEEINPGRKPDERKPRSQISERCRQHLIQETKKFAKKVSPLIDKCITSLIKDAENANQKSQYQKYDRRSLGEYLPSDFAARMNLGKVIAPGDSGEQNNRRDKYKSNDLTNLRAEKQKFTREQAIKSRSAATKSGKIAC